MDISLDDAAKEIVTGYFETDFPAWVGEELKKTAEETEKVARVATIVKWKAPIWDNKYDGGNQEQSLVHEARSYKTLFDIVLDDGVGIKVTGDSVQIPKKPVDSVKNSHPIVESGIF